MQSEDRGGVLEKRNPQVDWSAFKGFGELNADPWWETVVTVMSVDQGCVFSSRIDGPHPVETAVPLDMSTMSVMHGDHVIGRDTHTFLNNVL